MKDITTTPHLTPRELQVLHLMAQGLHNKEIATTLNISEHTVKFHVTTVTTKTGQNTRLGAVIFGLKTGLLNLASLMPDIPYTPTPITATTMAILEENKVKVQRQHLRDNIVGDIMEELCEDNHTVLDEESMKRIHAVLLTYIPDVE